MLRTDTWERTEEHTLANIDKEENWRETKYEITFSGLESDNLINSFFW